MYLIQHTDGRVVELTPLRRYQLLESTSLQTLRVCAHRFYTKLEAEAVINACFDRDPALIIKEAPGVLMSTTKHGRELAAINDDPFQESPLRPFSKEVVKQLADDMLVGNWKGEENLAPMGQHTYFEKVARGEITVPTAPFASLPSVEMTADEILKREG